MPAVRSEENALLKRVKKYRLEPLLLNLMKHGWNFDIVLLSQTSSWIQNDRTVAAAEICNNFMSTLAWPAPCLGRDLVMVGTYP